MKSGGTFSRKVDFQGQILKSRDCSWKSGSPGNSVTVKGNPPTERAACMQRAPGWPSVLIVNTVCKPEGARKVLVKIEALTG